MLPNINSEHFNQIYFRECTLNNRIWSNSISHLKLCLLNWRPKITQLISITIMLDCISLMAKMLMFKCNTVYITYKQFLDKTLQLESIHTCVLYRPPQYVQINWKLMFKQNFMKILVNSSVLLCINKFNISRINRLVHRIASYNATSKIRYDCPNNIEITLNFQFMVWVSISLKWNFTSYWHLNKKEEKF